MKKLILLPLGWVLGLGGPCLLAQGTPANAPAATNPPASAPAVETTTGANPAGPPAPPMPPMPRTGVRSDSPATNLPPILVPSGTSNRFNRPALFRPGTNAAMVPTNPPAAAAAVAPAASGPAVPNAAGPAARPGPPVVAGVPPGPAAGAGATKVILPSGTNVLGLGPSGKIPEKLINFQVAPIDQVLSFYADLTGRSVLRPLSLPPSITFRNEQDLTTEEAAQALEAVLALNGIAMINVGDKFVSAVPTAQALDEGAPFSKLDAKDLPEAGQFVTKVVQLKHVQTSDLIQVLQSFSKVKNGIVPVEASQTLVLRDYSANVKRMLELIEKVDVEVESEYKLEVIPIKYGKVMDVYSTMSSLTGARGAAGGPTATGAAGLRRTGSSMMRGGLGTSRYGTGGYGSPYQQQYPYGSSYNQPGVYSPQAAEIGTYTPQAVQPGQVAGGTTSFNQRLQQLVSRAGQPTEVQLLKDAKVVPDERSNSLIVYATKDDMQMITNIISKVDRLMAQVLIEAIIMDVELTDSSTFGVSALMHPQQTGGLTSSAASGGGANLLSGITNLSSSVPSGFSYWGKYNGDMDVAVQALMSKTKGHVLATPRVQTTHAIQASFEVMEQIPYVGTIGGNYGGSVYGSYYTPSQVQFVPVQTVLGVTPYITPDGLVVMDIEQTISEVSSFVDIPNAGKAPDTTSRSILSTVSIQSGQSVVLGGYIRTQKSTSKSGIPVLSDIPLLGGLFRSTSHDNKRSELVVFLRPTVLLSPQDAAKFAEQEKMRLPGVREMEKEMQEDEQKRLEKADKVTGTKGRL